MDLILCDLASSKPPDTQPAALEGNISNGLCRLLTFRQSRSVRRAHRLRHQNSLTHGFRNTVRVSEVAGWPVWTRPHVSFPHSQDTRLPVHLRHSHRRLHSPRSWPLVTLRESQCETESASMEFQTWQPGDSGHSPTMACGQPYVSQRSAELWQRQNSKTSKQPRRLQEPRILQTFQAAAGTPKP
jgi:hypothetical protein